MNTPTPFQTEERTSFFQSNLAKMMMIGALTLVLLIPLALIGGLIAERNARQDEVTQEINKKWGNDVFFYGPILKVPYNVFSETVSVNQKTKETIRQTRVSTEFAYFFPDVLKNDASVNTKLKKRNNYESVVYNAKMQFSGNYGQPDFSPKNIKPENVEWDKATIMIRTTNLKSIRELIKINFNGTDHALEPVYDDKKQRYSNTDVLETGFVNIANLSIPGAKADFSLNISYNGSNQIRFIPIGKATNVHMTSNWTSPSYQGNFLPSDRTGSNNEGFTANWKVLHVNRAFSQQSFEVLPDLSEFAFGVDFVVPVDQYQQNERAVKYGFLVIVLTFLIFFLIQVVSKIKIHIFNYGMIGLSLVMFYTLLISITEHSSFAMAYGIAGVAVVGLISLYSWAILRNVKFPLLIAGSLSGLYSFIYVIIQLEDYALLVGSIGLFVILATVMFISRKIDWSK